MGFQAREALEKKIDVESLDHNIENPNAGPNTEQPTAFQDYAGAVSKTDPGEIALVRKLDLRIMPILWAMYFLNFVSKSPCLSRSSA